MKKVLILILAISMCFIMAGCSKQKTEGSNLPEITKNLHDSEFSKVTFAGIDEENNIIKFEVENKTDKEYMFIVQTVKINGKDETPNISNVVQPKSKTIYEAPVSTVKDYNTVNAEVLIYDMTGATVETYKIENKRVK